MNRPAVPAFPLRFQHTALIERLAGNRPHHIPSFEIADSLDVEERGEHVVGMLDEVFAYASKALGDLSASMSPRADFSDFSARLFELSNELKGAIDNAGERARVRAMEDAS